MIKKTLICGTLVLSTYIIPVVSFAADYVALSPTLPGSGTNNWLAGGMSVFLNRLFAISVAVAAILAILMLAIGGFKYMTSESVFKIGGAKEQITNAIVGLLIVLAAVVILTTINPDIVQLDMFTHITPNLC